MAALFIVDNARPEAILHVMSPVVSGASFGFWGNLRGVFSRDNGHGGPHDPSTMRAPEFDLVSSPPGCNVHFDGLMGFILKRTRCPPQPETWSVPSHPRAEVAPIAGVTFFIDLLWPRAFRVARGRSQLGGAQTGRLLHVLHLVICPTFFTYATAISLEEQNTPSPFQTLVAGAFTSSRWLHKSDPIRGLSINLSVEPRFLTTTGPTGMQLGHDWVYYSTPRSRKPLPIVDGL
ncbi:hypothetical protein V8E52_007216 [Russula decolorans]